MNRRGLAQIRWLIWDRILKDDMNIKKLHLHLINLDVGLEVGNQIETELKHNTVRQCQIVGKWRGR